MRINQSTSSNLSSYSLHFTHLVMAFSLVRGFSFHSHSFTSLTHNLHGQQSSLSIGFIVHIQNVCVATTLAFFCCFLSLLNFHFIHIQKSKKKQLAKQRKEIGFLLLLFLFWSASCTWFNGSQRISNSISFILLQILYFVLL
jgi:hypothetical protein